MVSFLVFFNFPFFFYFNLKFKGRKTPNNTPNKAAVKTPSGGDRFIPNRSTTNFELGHYMVNSFF